METLKTLKRCFLIFGLISCGISKDAQKSVESAFYPRKITGEAMATFLVHSTDLIYSKYSLKEGTPVYIHYLNASFETANSKPFELFMDSVRVKKYPDSIVMNHRKIPTYKFNLPKDTMKVTVMFRFRNPNNDSNIELECSHGTYRIFENAITKFDHFSPCDKK